MYYMGAKWYKILKRELLFRNQNIYANLWKTISLLIYTASKSNSCAQNTTKIKTAIKNQYFTRQTPGFLWAPYINEHEL
jgi:hypothetical protein